METTTRDVVIVVYDGLQLLDLAGPVDVLAAATRLAGGGYRVTTASVGGREVSASSGVRLSGHCDLADIVDPPPFLRELGVPPVSYRDRFHSTGILSPAG